eukprot:7675377-Pyramimonas_sp.AAC.1
MQRLLGVWEHRGAKQGVFAHSIPSMNVCLWGGAALCSSRLGQLNVEERNLPAGVGMEGGRRSVCALVVLSSL